MLSLECYGESSLFAVIMGKMTAKYRLGVVQQTDARIRILNGIIQGIQTIKMYALELPFMKTIGRIRKYCIYPLKLPLSRPN